MGGEHGRNPRGQGRAGDRRGRRHRPRHRTGHGSRGRSGRGRRFQRRGGARYDGAIVNTGSMAGLIGLPTSSAYVAAKHGVIGLTRTAALEYAEAKIRVNAVCPGFVQTQMTEDTMRRRGESILAQIPFRRMGQPGEIAEMVVWLCSERASYVTGAAYNVDGGWMAV